MSKIEKESLESNILNTGNKSTKNTILVTSRTMIPKSTSLDTQSLNKVTDLSSLNPYSETKFKDINCLPEKIQEYSKCKRVKWTLKSRNLGLQAEACMRLIESEQTIVRYLTRLLQQLLSEDWSQQNNVLSDMESYVPQSPFISSGQAQDPSEPYTDKSKKNKSGSNKEPKQNDMILGDEKQPFKEVAASKHKKNTSDSSLEEKPGNRENDSSITSENHTVPLTASPINENNHVRPDKQSKDELPDQIDGQASSGVKLGKLAILEPQNTNLNAKQTFNSLSSNLSFSSSSFQSYEKVVDQLIFKVQASLDHSRHYIYLLQQTRQALIRQNFNNSRLYEELREASKMPDPNDTSIIKVDI